MLVSEFAEAVAWYCNLARASVTSWIRSPAHNQQLGGVTYSPHLFGLGADVVYDEVPALPLRQEWAARLGLRLVVETDHDHLQPASWTKG